MTMRPESSYAHMCRDGHVQIGHNDSSSELCPLCRVQSALTIAHGALLCIGGTDSNWSEYARGVADEVSAVLLAVIGETAPVKEGS